MKISQLVLSHRRCTLGLWYHLVSRWPLLLPQRITKSTLTRPFSKSWRTGWARPANLRQAYVIAHEVGHHVQTRWACAEKVTRLQHQASEREWECLSVRMELQADCFAGVWGHHAKRERNLIEPGDFEEGLRAAAAIGDDQLQKLSRGSVQPESWTHGSSQQRMSWSEKAWKPAT